MLSSSSFGMRLRTGIAALAALTVISGGTTAKAEEFLTIGTGGVTGIYYAVGGGICRLVNQGRKEHGIRCSVESTGGSVYNLRTMRQGELEMGIVQSDWQFHALNGTSLFEENGPDEELRSLFSLHPDTVIIAARQDAEINSLDDLGGKRINMGNPGSGTRGTAEVLVEALGWDMDHFGLVTELKSAEQSSALCDNTIDAFLMVAGNPVANVLEAASSCDINIIAVDGDKVDALVESTPYYGKVTIPGGLYRGVDSDVPSFGLPSTFVTSTNVPEETVYVMVKTVFENFDKFKTFHPAFANLKKEEMVVNGLSAPMHPGAEKYFREVGLIE